MTAVEWVFAAAFLLMAGLAECWRRSAQFFAEEVLKQYEWIDEIIEALEADEDEDDSE